MFYTYLQLQRMNRFMKRLKKRALKKNVEIQQAINTFILPFTEMPSFSTTRGDNEERINAHDLFSQFTADIIKEDVVFAR